MTHSWTGRIDWAEERERIDLAAKATTLLGDAPGRIGERRRRLWWHCPFHEDPNTSFCIDPGRVWWKCYGCGEYGDAASLVMWKVGLTFPEAVARLTGGASWATEPTTSRSMPTPRPEPEGPRGLPAADALALVDESSSRLWASEGAGALA
jgi:hypothetical protein